MAAMEAAERRRSVFRAVHGEIREIGRKGLIEGDQALFDVIDALPDDGNGRLTDLPQETQYTDTHLAVLMIPQDIQRTITEMKNL